jgi:hypothetical protein
MKKKLILIIASILILSNISCIRAQDEEKQVISMLEEFYVAYNTVSANSGLDILKPKLDSLQKKYCTKRFQKELKKIFEVHGLDHDVLLNDVYTEDIESLKTMSITKDKTRDNTYLIIYDAVVTGIDYKKKIQKVQIFVVVAKEDGVFKIDNVLDN